tara:strand:+ start:438 stop:1118 length:681 start_codon:yes stop_codon:yes gene_type:complete
MSLINNIPCPHGEYCRYAHDISEVIPKCCLYGNNCKFVYNTKNKWFNNIKTNKICNFIHPNESKENFSKRIFYKKLCPSIKKGIKCKFGFDCKYSHELYNIKKCGIILFDSMNESILLVRSRKSKLWGFPKGHVEDFDKSLKHTAVRELLEETGFIVSPSDLDIIWKPYKDFILFIIDFNKIIKKTARTDNCEIMTQKFFNLNYLNKININDFNSVIFKYLNNLEN